MALGKHAVCTHSPRSRTQTDISQTSCEKHSLHVIGECRAESEALAVDPPQDPDPESDITHLRA